MTQYNSVNAKLLNSEHNKLKSATKSETGITLRLSSNLIIMQTIKLIFLVIYYWKIDKSQVFGRLLGIIHQLI